MAFTIGLCIVSLAVLMAASLFRKSLRQSAWMRDADISYSGLVKAMALTAVVSLGMTVGYLGLHLSEAVVADSTEALQIEAAAATAGAVDSSGYADGTYSGTGRGFRGDIQVAVTIAGGQITQVVVTDQQDDRKWFERAYSGMTERILAAQSADTDTVSGATYSSIGIRDAVSEALEQARAAAGR